MCEYMHSAGNATLWKCSLLTPSRFVFQKFIVGLFKDAFSPSLILYCQEIWRQMIDELERVYKEETLG